MGSRSKIISLAVAVTATATAGLAVRDLLQKKHSLLRNYPVAGHARYMLEDIRPQIQQYFIERNWDGRPFDRDTRSLIYARAKGQDDDDAFGTELDVTRVGAEYLVHSMAPVAMPENPPRVHIGGDECTQPYDMSLMNISAMSFGSLSDNAVRALNKGAELGGFLHDTGEGAISPYHQEANGDLMWELGTGYFGARDENGNFDPQRFRDRSADEQVKCVSLKLSQGAKPGLGGMLPGAKVTPEIAEIRGIPVGQDCISPAYHRAFSTPVELIEFTARMRELSGGKPAGFKLCVTSRAQVLAVCKAMLEVGTTPDFIIIDGSEGGTGAAPLEFEDHMGMPLTEGLATFHNALVGTGLRDRIKLGAAGKVAAGNDIVKRLIQGADFTMSARAMMMAIGCIQAQVCNTGKCPVGVATQNPLRARALDVEDKSMRVFRYHQATVNQAVRLMAAMGVENPSELDYSMLRKRVSHKQTCGFDQLFDHLGDGELLSQAPEAWEAAWNAASPHSFLPARK